ncbi:MAG: TonB-dependent receptor plug domain-containing protein [Raineya sp.]|jgi:TonB-dependent SusC/RagA subfamily outer membrane receptor|nr:TonB-dependent receptor plug domain-containing protein [Raineya sp.]
MKKTLLSLFLLVSIFSKAQKLSQSPHEGYYTYVYQLYHSQTKNIYTKGWQVVDSTYFTKVVDSFLTAKPNAKKMPLGDYLFVQPKESYIHYTLEESSNIKVNVVNNDRDLQIVVQDTTGRLISDAEVFVEGKKIVFDKKLNLYRDSKSYKEGILSVSYQGYTTLTSLDARFKKQFWRKIYYKSRLAWVWSYLKKPFIDIYRATKSSYDKAKWIRRIVAIFNKDEREDLRRESKWEKYYSTPDKSWKGYHVFSKPKYRPRDTVKFKMYLQDYKKIPVNEPVNVYLIGDIKGKRQTIKLKQIKPYQAGGYVLDFVLADSLQLKSGQQYILDFQSESYEKWANGKLVERYSQEKQAGYRRLYFTYEDYELTSITYNMRLAKEKHNEDELNHIYVSAKDENDLSQPDAKVTVIISTEKVLDFRGNEVLIKDTLWKHNQNLDAVGETKITIPDSIFRNAQIKYKVETTFLNSNNERTVKTTSAERFLEDAPIDFLAIKDSVVVRYFNPKKHNQSATLIVKDIFGQTKSKKTITLPYGFKTLGREIYEVQNYKQKSYTYDALSNKAGVSCYAEQTKDSLLVVIQNPRNTPVWYYIFEGDKPYFADFTTETIIFKRKGNANKNYFVSLSYWWNNSIQKEDYVTSLYTPKNDINIDLNAPKRITPGAKTTIEASVTDADSKPVADADVTVYGITGKFKEFSHSAFDKVQAKNKKSKTKGRTQRNFFELKDFNPNPTNDYYDNYFSRNKVQTAQNNQKLSWAKWKNRLDTIEYYKFLYPKDNFYLYTQPSQKGITQLAPYVTKNGSLDSVYYVLLDEIPVYASFTATQPYSFRIDNYPHTVKIRTKNSLVAIHNIMFKPYQKTILSVENLVDSTWKQKDITIQITKEKSTLSNTEITFLQKFLINLDYRYSYTPDTYLQQKETFIPLYNQNKNNYYGFWAGFFAPSEKVRFAQYGKYEIDFRFKGGHYHSFEDNVVMVEKRDIPSHALVALPLPINFDEEVYTWQDFSKEMHLKNASKASQNYVYHSNWNNTKSSVVLLSSPPQDSLEHIVMMSYKGKMINNFRLYRPSSTVFEALKPKETYHFVYFYGKDHHRKFTATLSEKGVLYKKVDDLPLLKNDSSINTIKKFLEKDYKHTIYDVDSLRLSINMKTAEKTVPLGKNTVTGYIFDEQGIGVPGATVTIKGTKLGTVTDVDGHYMLSLVPDNAVIITSSAGFRDKAVAINTKKQSIVNVILESDEEIAGIVVTTAYGQVIDKTLRTGSNTVSSSEFENIPIQSFDRALQGRMSGVIVQGSSGQPGSRGTVLIRGVGSVNSGNEPLYIVDGVPISASDFAKLNPADMTSMEVLKDGAATAIYGSRGANGVIVVETKAKGGAKPANKLSSQTPLEEATANNLEGSGLRSNFRDDAVWQPRLRTDKNGKVSFTTTFPDDLTRWDIYAFAGKTGGLFASAKTSIKATKQLTAMLSMPRFAVSGDSIEVVGKSTNFTSDTFAIKTRFEINKQIVSSKNQQIINGIVEKQWIVAERKDSLGVLYALEKDDYTDGELRKLPIYPKGTRDIKGNFVNLYKDSSVTWKFDKDKGTVNLHISADMLRIVEMELLHLKEYGYLCNEQAASKLLAYLMQERICKITKKPFQFTDDVKALVERLEKNVNPDGLWGWWGVSNTASWVSKHVLKALLEAKNQGYEVKINTSAIVKMYVVGLETDTTLSQRLENLEALDQLKAEVNYPKYLDSLEKKCLKNKKNKKSYNLLGFQEYLSLQILRQKHQLPYNLDTLKKTRKMTMYGNHYWSDASGYYNNEITYNSTQTTLKALKLLQNASKNNFEEQVLAVNYILEQRNNNGYWLHTYESISALEAIYPYISNPQGKIENPMVELSGGVNQTVKEYPFVATFSPEKELKIKRNQKIFSPVYITAYQEFWNEKPEKISNGFEVKSYFDNPNTQQNYLEAGKPVTLVVEVNAKQTQDYVLIEIPIPAGCSYDDKGYNYYNWDKQKHKICIFLDRMHGGFERYTIQLIPRYTGVYTLNPAKVEMMYKPTFVGRENLKKVVIKEKKL